MTPNPESKPTAEILEEVRGAVDDFGEQLTLSLARLEQCLAEAGHIPTAACPRCHGTGKVSTRHQDEGDH